MDVLVIVLLVCNGTSFVASTWLLRRICLLSNRLRAHLFAKQLWHLAIVDGSLALFNAFYLTMSLVDDAPDLTKKIVVAVVVSLLCTNILMSTSIAIGFALVFWKLHRCAACLKRLRGVVWILGCGVGVAVHFWFPMLSIWMFVNLVVAASSYMTCFCIQRPGITQAVVWRMARVYAVTASIGIGAWLVAYMYWKGKFPHWFACYSFAILGLQGVLNAVTYAYNARLVAQNFGTIGRSILNPRSHSPIDTTQVLVARLSALVDDIDHGESDRNSSVFSFDSFLGVHGRPAEDGASITPRHASALISSFSDARSRDVEISQASIEEILGRIDSKWLEELRINTYAEVFNVVHEAASQLESGADLSECVSRARLKVDEVKDWALESVKIRSEARSFVSLCSDCSEIESSVVEWHAQAISATNPLFEKLQSRTELDKVKDASLEMIRKCQGELESVSTVKENDTNNLFEANSMLIELQQVELAFAENVLQVARANPQSTLLQRSGLQALLKLMVVFNLSGQQEADRCFLDFFDYAQFVLDVMAAHREDPVIQRDACIFLHRYAGTSGARVSHICDMGAAESINKAMSNHQTDASVQLNGHSALMAFTMYGSEVGARVESLAEQSLQNEISMQGLPSDS